MPIALLKPFGITRYSTDGWDAYERHVDAEQHTVGQEHMQSIASKHSTLRTRIKRLVRRTICFAKTEHRPDLVIGLFVSMIMSPCTTVLGPHGTRMRRHPKTMSPRCWSGF